MTDWRHDLADQLADSAEFVVRLWPEEPTDDQKPLNAVAVMAESWGTGSTLVGEVGADDDGYAWVSVRAFNDDGVSVMPTIFEADGSVLIYASALETTVQEE